VASRTVLVAGPCHACGREVSHRYKAHLVPARQYCDNACRHRDAQAVDHGDGTCSPAVASCRRVGLSPCGVGHGAWFCYQEGCRCPACTDANRLGNLRLRMRRYVARAAGEEVPAPHGSVSAYTNHGCRCDPCRDGHRHRIAVSRRRTCRCRACVRATVPA